MSTGGPIVSISLSFLSVYFSLSLCPSLNALLDKIVEYLSW